MSRRWFLELDGKTIGPLSSTQLKEHAIAAKIKPNTPLRLGENGEWTRASMVRGLFTASEIPTNDSGVAAEQIAETSPARIVVSPPAQITAQQGSKPCPLCGESIATTALKCHRCHVVHEFRSRGNIQHPPVAQEIMGVLTPLPSSDESNETKVTEGATKTWSPLVAALLSLMIPGLGQFYKRQFIYGLVWLVIVPVAYVANVVLGIVVHVCCVCGAAMGDRVKAVGQTAKITQWSKYELGELAAAQKMIGVALGVGFLTVAILFATSPASFRPLTMPPKSFFLFLAPVALFQMVAVYRMASALKRPIPVLSVLGYLVAGAVHQLIPLILILVWSRKATNILLGAGLPVGFFGTRSHDIARMTTPPT